MINGFLKWIKDSQRANIFPLRRGLNPMKRAGSDETYNKDRVAYLAAEIIRHKDR